MRFFSSWVKEVGNPMMLSAVLEHCYLPRFQLPLHDLRGEERRGESHELCGCAETQLTWEGVGGVFLYSPEFCRRVKREAA